MGTAGEDPEYVYPQAEYHKAGSILMYTSGTELFDGVIHPDAGLYERYFDIDKASDEHRNYISMLEKQGCTVHTVTDVPLAMPHSRLVALAEASLSYDVSRLPRSERKAQTTFKQQVLASMSHSDLVRIILNRPTVKLKKSGINTGFEAQYLHNPLMNMYFLRDQSITTPKGHILCRMNSSQRGPEVDIIEACYEQPGEPAGQKTYRQEPAYSGKGFREFLQSRGVRIIRISQEDADHYANHFLTVDARHIMSVAGQSKTLEAEYEKNGVKVEWVPLDNLIGGYGAAHCMTQVLRRSNRD